MNATAAAASVEASSDSDTLQPKGAPPAMKATPPRTAALAAMADRLARAMTWKASAALRSASRAIFSSRRGARFPCHRRCKMKRLG